MARYTEERDTKKYHKLWAETPIRCRHIPWGTIITVVDEWVYRIYNENLAALNPNYDFHYNYSTFEALSDKDKQNMSNVIVALKGYTPRN